MSRLELAGPKSLMEVTWELAALSKFDSPYLESLAWCLDSSVLDSLYLEPFQLASM